MNKDNKTLYIIGGVNGAGKSTFVDNSFGNTDVEILNVDKIAYKLGGDYSYKSNMEAGQYTIKKLQDWPKTGKSLVWETVLSNSYYTKVIKNFKEFGYNIDLTYIFLEDQQTHKERIKERVINGGHDIPKDVLERRFSQRKEKFEKAISYADNWRMLCNQNPWFEFVAFGHGNEKIVSNFELMEMFYNPLESEKKIKMDIKRIFGFFVKNIIK